MAHSLASLLWVIRLLVVVLGLAVVNFVVRGEQASVNQLLSIPRSIGAIVTTSSTPVAVETTPLGRAQLRRELQRLFAHHATLVVRFMRATVSEDPGFVDAANAAVARHTQDLDATLRRTLDPEDATLLANEWAAQTQALFAYATALRDGDDAAREAAREQLHSQVAQHAVQIVEATGGRVDENVAITALQMQVDLLQFQIDAYARADHDQAYELQREAYAQLAPFAETLAAGATAHRRDTVDAPAEELTAQMSRLLGAHAELSIDALRAGVSGSDEFAAATAAVQSNGQDLSSALEALLGTRPSRKIDALWATQTDLLVRYAVAVAEHDPATRREVRDRLMSVAVKIGRTLQRTTDGAVHASAVASALRSHQMLLLDQLEVYAVADYATAHDISYVAHGQINDLAHSLATSFVDVAQTHAPSGGAATGGGGTATNR